MEQRISTPMPVAAIARRLRLSRRQLDRQFLRVFAATTSDVYLLIRVTRARKLIRSTGMELREVAEACGFAAYAGFSRAYRKVFGVTPRRERGGSPGETSTSLRLMPVFDLHPDQTQHDPAKLL
jgi:AraC family carnitine catabolism transcriptional activator